VCAAPPLPSAGACAFCGAPLDGDGTVTGLLDYVAARVPGAEAGRGMLGKGPVRELRVRLGGADLHVRLRRDGLELAPAVEPEAWVGLLVSAFTAAASADHGLRRALSRTGWAWRSGGREDG
jgi:hypothetical protein